MIPVRIFLLAPVQRLLYDIFTKRLSRSFRFLAARTWTCSSLESSSLFRS